MKKILVAASICLGALFLFLACQQKPPQAPAAAKAPSREKGTVVFLDTSVSMRGYFNVAPAAGAPLQQFILADLLGILAEDNLTPVYLSPFGSEIASPQEVKSLRKWSFFESLESKNTVYSQSETNLLGAFEGEAFVRHDVSIIISDGIQSSAEGSQNIAGFDTRIFNVIRKRSQTGTFLWLIGVKSKFRGIVYPERPCPDGIRRSFHYGGVRPIYVWIGSQDLGKGLGLVTKMVERIHSLLEPSETVRVAALNFVHPPEIKMSMEPESSSSPIKRMKESANGSEYLIKKTQQKEIDIPLAVSENKGKIQSEFWNMDWNLNIEVVSDKAKWARTIKKNGNWHLVLNYNLIPGSSFFKGCMDDHQGRLRITASSVAAIRQNPWWREWSTQNDCRSEDAGKTLHLEKLSPMIEEPLHKKYDTASIDVKFNRP